ncbi:hypothetical protein VOLCADRAFT_116082 [Volvox carteri f. nagariensis]|uniref:C-CAP/cofactor C-like domain-containing protein n=1 Tax=Volvox carteri f. nagariensis TaxID=3068 RepID=D8TJS0_VOLCA|nr:uncharacterized protein VOLCADRAFT_116082 [Volvox carteri f. nagariensis]EFJ52420.1 hypothetical protein VOLCADRAFT_116082 [Volvox carteri f. nagariensis]|eukprot:XP_002946493.1 hypothetical protein VOLCADRAFT_116082 [Volvox carteri f. nagariensis]
MDPNDYVFRKRTNEILIKLPGSINGNGFVLDTLHDCEVYLLDHTSQVQIDDCINCKIFIGPIDGSVFLRDCRDCTLCVAARQLRTRDCKDLDIALYCATQPSIETSTGIVFSCWRGAYPGLTRHFGCARLDPAKNTWRQVYDFNRTEDLGAPHFQLDESVRPWWTVPPTGEGSGAGGAGAGAGGGPWEGLGAAEPDCPVPRPDGSLYDGGYLPVVQSPPKPPAGSVKLPESLPPSPGRAAAYDEEVELEDEDEEEEEEEGVEDNRQEAANAASSGGGAVLLPANISGSSSIGFGGQLSSSGEPQLALPPHAHGLIAVHAGAGPAATAGDVDARVAWRAANSRRLSDQAAAESRARGALRDAARSKLESLQQVYIAAPVLTPTAIIITYFTYTQYCLHHQPSTTNCQARVALLKQRFATNRAAHEKDQGGGAAAAADAGRTGGAAGTAANVWERVAELVDLKGGGGVKGGKVGANVATATGAGPSRDVTRLRQLMIALRNSRGRK